MSNKHTALYLSLFEEHLKKYRHLAKSIIEKTKYIAQNPLMGEPLRHNLSGLYSYPVKRNFIIVYIFCKQCDREQLNEWIGCPDCEERESDRIIFLVVGPHDDAYKIAKKLSSRTELDLGL